MNTHEYAMALGTLLLFVMAVGFLGQASTGLFHLDGKNSPRTRQISYGIERPIGSLGMQRGEAFAPPFAQQCEMDMRYLGRNYTKYIRCCSDKCTTPCKRTVSASDVRDCVYSCGHTCEAIMTNDYLSRPPGSWR